MRVDILYSIFAMQFRRDLLPPAALLIVAVLIPALALAPELSIGRYDLNDNVAHFAIIERMAQTIEAGGNPLDFWVPEWTFGYPVPRTYQLLPYSLVVAVYFALAKAVPILTVFLWIKYLAIVGIPLSVFAAARWLGLPAVTAAIAAIFAPLLATNGLYGLELNSFLWAGGGLYTQAVAVHFLLATIGFGYQALRTGKHLTLAGLLVGLLMLSNVVYGYFGALTLVLFYLLNPARRFLRLAWIGGVSALLSAFEILPVLTDGATLNRSRWEPVWKWDSFGAQQVIEWLVTGALLDFGRWPVLTAFALLGAGLAAWNARDRKETTERTLLIAALFWILFFFGRPVWGQLLVLLGVTGDMHLHRAIGPVQVFLVLLAASGGAALWAAAAKRTHVAVPALLAAAVFAPMIQERNIALENNRTWGLRNLAANQAAQPALDTVFHTASNAGGRTYAGLGANWGAQFKIGDVPVYARLGRAHIPALSYLYHAMPLTADLMVRFDERSLAHYRLFNIQTVIAPLNVVPQLPRFLLPGAVTGSMQTLQAPGGGYFESIDVAAAVALNRDNFYPINDRWLQSEWVGRRTHLWIELPTPAPPAMPRLTPDSPLPPLPGGFTAPGEVTAEKETAGKYEAKLTAIRAGYVLLKMSWHQNWRAWVDGQPAPIAMVSPGFPAVPVPAGTHQVAFQYQPDNGRYWVLLGGWLLAVAAVFLERHLS